jgi:ATP-binding cassette, subfamily B, bacterial CvaB/MchF/RaxB
MNSIARNPVQPNPVTTAETTGFRAINFKPWEAMGRLPTILQTEISECGLACLAMVSSYFGLRTDLASLRLRLGTAQDGMNLKQLIVQANRIGLSARVVKAELNALKHLKAPCILHWDLNHFVVLKKAGRRKIVIHDPSLGVVKMTYAEASTHFTGFAVDFEPNQNFVARDERKIPTLKSIIGRTDGMYSALAHIFALALLLQLVGLASPAAMQWMIDNAFGSADKRLIVTVVAGMALLMLINLTVGLIRTWMVTYLSTSIGFQWSSRVLTHLLHLPIDFFERRHLGDIMSRFGSVSAIQRTVTTGVIEGILDGLMSIVTLIMIWLYSPKLALTAIAALVALTLLQLLSFEALKRNAKEALVADARASSNFMESIRGIRPIKLSGRANDRRTTWQNLSIEAINIKIRGQWLSIAIGTVGSLISGTQRIVAIYLAASLIYQGQFTVGMLFAYLSYQDQFMGRAGNLVRYFFEVRMLRLHFERLADIVLTPTEGLAQLAVDDSDDSEQHLSAPVIRLGDMPAGLPSVQFSGVSFKYSEFSRNVVDGLSFSSAGSKCTVITGKSGVGKTTIAKMILGIYKPASGQIRINGKLIEEIDIDSLRQQVASVLQGDALFAGSIRDNIAFFDSEIDQTWVEECAKIACIHDDIQGMMMGYHTPVGDMGSTLSAGQKQRVLMARALYRRPKILLLDEATSDLDVATEELINVNLSNLELHRIYIAHRPQTIKFGDQVVHIEDGHCT